MLRFGRAKNNKPRENPPKSRVGRSWIGLFALALVFLAFIWWQDQRNQVTLENLSSLHFSGTLNLPDGRLEPVELAPGKSAEWTFDALKEAHIEVKGIMGDALVRVKGGKISKGQARIRARFRLTPDGSVQFTDR